MAKITPKQIDERYRRSRDIFLEEYRREGTQVRVGDRSVAEAAFERIYKRMSLPRPKIFWCDSPLQMVVISRLPGKVTAGAGIADMWEVVETELFGGSSNDLPVRVNAGALQSRIESTFAQGYSASDDVVDSGLLIRSVRNRIEDEGRHVIMNYSSRLLQRLLLSRVDELLAGQLLADCGEDWQSQRRDASANLIRTELCHGWSLAKAGLRFSEDLTSAINDWTEVSRNCFWFSFDRKEILVCDFPTHMNCDAQGNLHNAQGPAMRFADDYSMFVWHGRIVPRIAIEGDLSIEIIESMENVEVRRAMIDRYGAEKYMLESGMHVFQQDEYGTLYRKSLSFDEPIVMVQVINKTAEPDGTFSSYLLRVPPWMKTARQAIAWTFGFDNEDDYNPMQES